MEDLDVGGRTEGGVDATKATRVYFVDTAEDLDKEGYAPLFTHQLFDEERIHGFVSVSVKVAFAAGSMACHYAVRKGAQKRDEQDDPTDIEGELAELLDGADKSRAKFLQRVEKDRARFRPVGTKMSEYTLPTPKAAPAASPAKKVALTDATTVYELYRGDLTDPEVLAFHQRAELAAFFYIDAASKIETDHPWEIFYIFAKRTQGSEVTYTTVGYCTVAIFYHYPDKERRRIAQFLILPPYQRQGHGPRLYEAVFADALANPKVFDVTVEAPAEHFQLMRDRSDVRRLRDLPEIDAYVKLPLKSEEILAVAKLTKLSRRQASRVLEILLLKKRRSDAASQRAYRLHVKARLARENEIDIANLEDRREKQEQLVQLYNAEEAAYVAVLNSL